MSPVDSPVSTFKFDELSEVGLINQGAINGDLHRHVYVGEDYVLREVALHGQLTQQYTVAELGYKRYMKELIGEDIIITYDPAKKDFYIGNSTKTYLLSPYGMTEVKQHPSAVWRSDNKSCMLPDAIDAHKHYLCTEIFNMAIMD